MSGWMIGPRPHGWAENESLSNFTGEGSSDGMPFVTLISIQGIVPLNMSLLAP